MKGTKKNHPKNIYKNTMYFSKVILFKITFSVKLKSVWGCSLTVLISVRMIKSKVQKTA